MKARPTLAKAIEVQLASHIGDHKGCAIPGPVAVCKLDGFRPHPGTWPGVLGGEAAHVEASFTRPLLQQHAARAWGMYLRGTAAQLPTCGSFRAVTSADALWRVRQSFRV